MQKPLLLLLAVFLLSGCGVAVVPRPTATASLDPATNALRESTKGVTVSVRVEDLEVAPYRMVDNLTSFHVTVENGLSQEISFPLTSFLLIDDEGHQYRPIEPAKVQEIVGRDSMYLIPYPYVGYYYLEDKEKSAFANTFESALPYYAENYPQDIFTQALPAGSIVPGAKISGLVYFVIDLVQKRGIELRVYRPGTAPSGPPDFTFPFAVEKK